MGYCIIKVIGVLSVFSELVVTNGIRNDPRYGPIQRNFRRHIGAVIPPTDWEAGLREAANQALIRERYMGPNLRERLYAAPIMGRQYSATPFGDVAVLARGQLYATPDGFIFVQDPYHNDCDDCRRRCDRLQCDTWRPRGFERLIALWTVKRLRHHDLRNGHYYELEYTISPISAAIREAFVTRNGGFDYSVPGHVFIVKPKPSPLDNYQSINAYETFQKDHTTLNTEKSPGWYGGAQIDYTPEQFTPPEHLPPPPPPLNSGEYFINAPFTTHSTPLYHNDIKPGVFIGFGPSGIKHVINGDVSYEKTEQPPRTETHSQKPDQQTQSYDQKEIELLKNLLLQLALKTTTPNYSTTPIALEPVTTNADHATTISYKFVPATQTTTSHPGYAVPPVLTRPTTKPKTTLIPVDKTTFTKLQKGEIIPIGFTTELVGINKRPQKPGVHESPADVPSPPPAITPIYIQYSDHSHTPALPPQFATRPTKPMVTTQKPVQKTKLPHTTPFQYTPTYSEEDEDIDVFPDEIKPTTSRTKPKGPPQLPTPGRGKVTLAPIVPLTATQRTRSTTRARQFKPGKKQLEQLVINEIKVPKSLKLTTPRHTTTRQTTSQQTTTQEVTSQEENSQETTPGVTTSKGITQQTISHETSQVTTPHFTTLQQTKTTSPQFTTITPEYTTAQHTTSQETLPQDTSHPTTDVQQTTTPLQTTTLQQTTTSQQTSTSLQTTAQETTLQNTTPQFTTPIVTTRLTATELTTPQLSTRLKTTPQITTSVTTPTITSTPPYSSSYRTVSQFTTSYKTPQLTTSTRRIPFFATSRRTTPFTTPRTTKTPTEGFLTKVDEYTPKRHKKPQIITNESDEDFDIFGESVEKSTPHVISTIQYDTPNIDNDLFGDTQTTNHINRETTEAVLTTTSKGPKIIFSNFYEASTAPPTTNLDFTTFTLPKDTTIVFTPHEETTLPEKLSTLSDKESDITTNEKEPLTSQSYSTSISFEVNKINRNKTETPKLSDDPIKATITEVDQNNSTVKIYAAEIPDKINTFQKPMPAKVSENSKAFEHLTLSLANHARSLDYLNSKDSEPHKYKRRSFKPRAKRLKKKEQII